MPYLSIYLDKIGLTSHEIGLVTAAIMAVRIVSPYVWGWWSDLSQDQMKVIRAGACFAFLVWLGLWRSEVISVWLLAVLLGLFSFFWNAVLPQFEAVTLSFLQDKTHLYGRIRLWGSLGFIGSAVGIGYVLQHTSALFLIPILLGLLAIVWLMSYFVPKPAVASHHQQPLDSIIGILKKPEVRIFLIIAVLVQFSHGPYYTFYSLYLLEHGHSKSLVGWLWSLGVFSEIILFWFTSPLLQSYTWKRLLIATLSLGVLRWQLIAWGVEDMGVLLLAQFLHAVSFGLFHLLAMDFIQRHFKGRSQGRGQALYGGMGFGLGGTLGSWASGVCWQTFGAIPTFTGASVALLLGVLLCFYIRRN